MVWLLHLTDALKGGGAEESQLRKKALKSLQNVLKTRIRKGILTKFARLSVEIQTVTNHKEGGLPRNPNGNNYKVGGLPINPKGNNP